MVPFIIKVPTPPTRALFSLCEPSLANCTLNVYSGPWSGKTGTFAKMLADL